MADTNHRYYRAAIFSAVRDRSTVTVSRALQAYVPLLAGDLTNPKRLRFPSDESIHANARCAPFIAEQDGSLCLDCHAAEMKNQDLLNALFQKS